jgi:thioredoxin 1
MIKVYSKQELKAELENSKQVLALFYASWCSYCMRFLPIFEEGIAELKFEKTIHVMLDDYNNTLWDDFYVSAVPTIILFEEGKVSKRLDGRLGAGLKEERFRTWLYELKR